MCKGVVWKIVKKEDIIKDMTTFCGISERECYYAYSRQEGWCWFCLTRGEGPARGKVLKFARPHGGECHIVMEDETEKKKNGNPRNDLILVVRGSLESGLVVATMRGGTFSPCHRKIKENKT